MISAEDVTVFILPVTFVFAKDAEVIVVNLSYDWASDTNELTGQYGPA